MHLLDLFLITNHKTKKEMNNQIIYDWSDVCSTLIGVVLLGALLYGLYRFYEYDAERQRAKELFLSKKKDTSFLDLIESESIYCGGTQPNAINLLYTAAKRARKDKALARDIRTELDKAINQFENSILCQN